MRRARARFALSLLHSFTLSLFLLFSSAALAQTAADPRPGLTPEQQASLIRISSQLRCLVCQGEAVE